MYSFMKLTHLFFLVLLFVCFSGLTQAQTEKFEPQSGMVELSKRKVILKVGQKAYYQGIMHGSVGIGIVVNIKDEEILKYIDKHFAYHRVQVEGMTGGDKATQTYIFEALKKGKTKMIFQEVMRGEILKKHTIKIIVKKSY